MPRGLRGGPPRALREEMRADVWPPRTSLLPGVHLPARQRGLPSLYIIAEGAPARHITSQAHLEERLAALAGDALTREALSRCDCHEQRRLAPPPPRNTVAKGHPGYDEIVANVYSRAANQCAGYHTDQSELLGATSNILSEDKLAALEEEVAKLRLRVAELEEHSSGAATG